MDRRAWVVITVAVMLVVYFLLGRAKRLPVAVICPHSGSLLPPKRRAALTHPASGELRAAVGAATVDRPRNMNRSFCVALRSQPVDATAALKPLVNVSLAIGQRCSGRRPSSPTAGHPCSGACATRAYAAPRAAPGACRQASTPTRVRASGRDADTNGAALGHPAAGSAGHDTIVDFDTEGGTRIACTATRSDLNGPTAVETRSRLRRIPRGYSRNRDGGDDRSP
jgi:hypothetical protein